MFFLLCYSLITGGNMSILKIENVSKKIKGEYILKNISFEINENKIIGLIGPNGAGKTTLLKTIVGLYTPTTGKIYINGLDLEHEFEDAIENIGSVIETPILYENLTGKENFKVFSMMFKNIPRERVIELISVLSLEKYCGKKVKTYSLGMKQRLGLAVALINDPSIIILDEPTNGLDPIGMRDLRNFLRSLKNKTIIISSHILSEIESVCDEVIFMNNGEIIDIKELSGNLEHEFLQKMVNVNE